MTKVLLPTLFLISLCGAAAEGLWTGAPTALVQFNGLILLLSALAIGTLALIGGSAPTSVQRSKGS